MRHKIFSGRPIRDVLWASLPFAFLFVGAIWVVYKFIDPAPPRHITISTSDGEGDYQRSAELYRDILAEDGVELRIMPSSGAIENLHRLEDEHSDVDAGFVQDGIGSTEKGPDLVSLGSLYYEPIWVFYRGKSAVSRFSQMLGKRVALGHRGGGARILARRLLNASGVDEKNTRFVELTVDQAGDQLQKGKVDAAIFIATPDDAWIKKLVADPQLRLMSVDQAEAITRHFPYLHHLVLPHGAIDLKSNLPAQDIDLLAPTATLVVRDSLHPALVYLLLKAAAEVHSGPGIFEKKGEFPSDKDDVFPLSDDARRFYKSGAPFWQRYLPFWLAILVDRFLLVAIPLFALALPMIKSVPRILEWRVKSRIYRRYGELKFLETQMRPEAGREKFEAFLHELDRIEERVNQMKIPLDFSDHLYVLREHIDFVRQRIHRVLARSAGT